MLVRKIFCRAVIELFTAIVTEYDPRKHTDVSTASRSALLFAKLLYDSKGFSVNDGRMSILKYLPIFFGNVYPRFVLERLGCVTEIDRVTHILLLLQEICNRSCYPPSGNSWRSGTFAPNAYPMLRGCGYLFFGQLLCDLRRSESFHAKREDLSYYLGSRLINQPLLWIIRIFHIAVGQYCSQRNTRFALMLEYFAHLLRGVLGVHFIEPILHGKKITKSSPHNSLAS